MRDMKKLFIIIVMFCLASSYVHGMTFEKEMQKAFNDGFKKGFASKKGNVKNLVQHERLKAFLDNFSASTHKAIYCEHIGEIEGSVVSTCLDEESAVMQQDCMFRFYRDRLKKYLLP